MVPLVYGTCLWDVSGPCQYDVGSFKSCMSSKRNAAWEWTAWNNCGDFVEAAVTDCLSKAQYDK